MKIYAVGGSVRDALMGLPVNDFDYVVVGSTIEEMIALGYRPVGKDFPVFLHPLTNSEYALARTERKTGQGYKGFVFYVDPTVQLEDDLRRRDLTINAMAQEVDSSGKLVGEIIDPYNGQNDLAAKIFRHVSSAFSEDPLRLLRVARFSACFPEFSIAEETVHELKNIVERGELSSLSPERIWQEISKGLIAKKPMRMLQVLIDTGAANAMLPLALIRTLVDENSREILNADFNALGHKDIEISSSIAVALLNLSSAEIRAWAECVRMPNDVRDFAELFSDLHCSLQKKNWAAQEVLAWLNRADAWRKPDRTEKLIHLGEVLGLGTDFVSKAFRLAKNINVAQVIEKLCEVDKANGEKIRTAIELARLRLIQALSDQMLEGK